MNVPTILFSCIPPFSFFSGIFNVDIGSGTYLGGLTAESGHLAHIGYVGAAIAAVAALLCRHVYLKAVRGR